MTQGTARVLVFDSGVGALSIVTEIRRLLPSVELIAAMDCEGFPYGNWEEEALATHICDLLDKLNSECRPDLIVVACNSASTAVLPALRERIRTPVVGVVPAIKPAAALTRSGVVGLLATPATIGRQYTEQLINDFASHCKIIRMGSAVLAPAIERLYWEGEEDPSLWGQVMKGFEQQPDSEAMDTVVLACTHFPLVKDRLAAAAPDLQWVDSGEAIARRVRELIGDLPLSEESAAHQDEMPEPRQRALIIGPREPTRALLEQLHQLGFTHYQCMQQLQLGTEHSCKPS